MKFQNPSITVHDERTGGRMDGWTKKTKPICLVTFFEVRDIIKASDTCIFFLQET